MILKMNPEQSKTTAGKILDDIHHLPQLTNFHTLLARQRLPAI